MFKAFLQSICNEWNLVKKKYLNDDFKIETVFLGGGTPSILSESSWIQFNNTFLSQIPKKDYCEITLECNPESFTESKARVWLESGVNRLSIGIQSLNDEELHILGRVHNSQLVIELLKNPILKQFNSINADLMFGIPDQTLKSLEYSINTILSSNLIKHLSIYELTLSEGTQFFENQKHLSLPDDDEISQMNYLIIEKLKNKNLLQYEVSNFSLKGYECKHNLNYWNYSPYIGLGPGAHSFMPPFRFANTPNLKEYNIKISNSQFPYQFTETLSKDEIVSELIFLGLRTVDGIDEIKFKDNTGLVFANDKRINKLNKLVEDGFLIHSNSKWQPTEKGILYADSISKKLI